MVLYYSKTNFMSIKDRFKENKNKYFFWFIIVSVAIFSFSSGYLLGFEKNPTPLIIEKCSSIE